MNRRDIDAALYEGAAEYASLQYAVDAGIFTAVEADSFLQSKLNQCVEQVGSRPLQAVMKESPSVRYSCGLVLSMLIDGQDAPRGRGFFNYWTASAAGGLAHLSMDSVVQGKISGDMQAQWSSIAGALSGRHGQVRYEVGVERYQAAIFTTILDLNCGEADRGFETSPLGVRLTTSSACGVLAGSPFISLIEGRSISSDAERWYRAADASCRKLGYLRARISTSAQDVNVRCPQSGLPVPERQLVVANWWAAGRH